MEIVFYNRDFSGRLPVPGNVKMTIERYSKHQIGLCRDAYFHANLTDDKWDLLKLLRAPVEIWDDDRRMWWGYVNKITVPIGKRQRRGLRLDEMFNYVTVSYSGSATSAASDAISISEYGQKEIKINDYNATLAEAEQVRDVYLEDHSDAIVEIEFTGGSKNIEFECLGWFQTLGWKYYSNGTSSNVSNTTQISTIVGSAGQFIAGTIIEDAAGVTSDQSRDGNATALTYIVQLLNAGTSNTRPLLATVDESRYLHVYERDPAPPADEPDYLINSDGKLVDALGNIIPDRECKCAVWVKDKSVPSNLQGFATMRASFIEGAEYFADRDETVYSFANAYEQARLARYIAEVMTGNSFGGSKFTTPNMSLPDLPSFADLSALAGTLSSFPYAVLLSLNGSDSLDVNGLTFSDSSPRAPQASGYVDWTISTSSYPTGLYVVTAGIFGSLATSGYSWSRILAENYATDGPTVPENQDGTSANAGSCVTVFMLDPGDYINYTGVIYQDAGGYQGFDRAWFCVIRIGDG